MYPTIINFGTIHLGPVRLPIAIHSYGLMLAFAFLTVLFILQRELARKKLDPQLASSIIFAGAVGGIVGAKLYSALQDGTISMSELFSNSGLVWYGGVIGGSAAILFVIYRSNSPILPTIDALGPLLLLGYGIGRIGCFLSGDGDYGPPSNLPWAMAFPNGTVPTNVLVHPTPLYETGMSLIGFGVLWAIRKRKEETPGQMFGGYLILAGVERFLSEFWRINRPVLFGLTTAQFTSFLLIIIGGFLLYWVTQQSKRAVVGVKTSMSSPPQRRKNHRR